MNSLGIWVDFSVFQEISPLASKSPQTFCLSSSWLIISTKDSELLYHPLASPPLHLNLREKVNLLCCNSTLALILTTSGDLWLFGQDPNNLFLPETLTEFTPMKLPKFAENRITHVSLSSKHGAAVCTGGLLYTWGAGPEGELCSDSTLSRTPQAVAGTKIFHIVFVVCGEGYTGICTTAGYFYLYGKNQWMTGEVHSGPFNLASLENYFIEKAFDSEFGVVLLTDEGKCVLLEKNVGLVALNSHKKIESVAVCRTGISGLSMDKSKIYVWKKKDFRWETQVFKFKKGRVEKIASGLNNSIVMLGCELSTIAETLSAASESPETTPSKEMNKDRKIFQLIYKQYDSSPMSSSIKLSKEGIKHFAKFVNRQISRVFKTLQNYSYMIAMMKRAYATSITPNSIEKAVQRLNLIHKSFALKMIYKFSRGNYEGNTSLRKNTKAIVKMYPVFNRIANRIIFRIVDATTAHRRLRAIMKGQIVPKIAKIISRTMKNSLLRLLRLGNKESLQRSRAKKLIELICSKRISAYIEPLTNSKLLKMQKLALSSISRILKKINLLQLKKYSRFWLDSSKSKKPVSGQSRLKVHASTMLYSYLSKLILRSYSSLFSLSKPKKSQYQLKCGAFMLCSTLLKIINVNRIHSFSMILRLKCSSHNELIASQLKVLYSKRLIYGFQCIKVFSITNMNKKIVKFVLFLQSFGEKKKYRQALRGLNAFKLLYFSCSQIMDSTSDRPSKGSSYGIIITPPSSPNLVRNELEIPKITKSSSSNNIERRLSLHTFQQTLIKKFSDKITQESKSTVIGENNNNGKGKAITYRSSSKQTATDKRNAYAESQKKKIQQKNGKGKEKKLISMNDKKAVESLIRPNLNGLFDEHDRKIIKYRNGLKPLAQMLGKLREKITKPVFYLIKACAKPINPKRSEMKSTDASSKSPAIYLETHKSSLKLIRSKNLITPREKISEDYLHPTTKNPSFKSPSTKESSPVIAPATTWKLKLLSLGIAKLSRFIKIQLYRETFNSLL